jgi:NhaP-type Na+/H+ or K+/H+ antiporter
MPFSVDLFLSTLGLIGFVIVVAALFSGAVERSGVPQVLVFLLIGALIGPFGLGLLDAGPESPILRVVATLSLALVLFTDAVSLNLKEVRQQKMLTALVLGPGTLISAALIAVLAWALLGLHPALAVILGAGLSSTDPVLLRSFLRRPGLDAGVRQALRLESGMNDAVLLPVVLGAIAFSTRNGMAAAEWVKLSLETLVLGPALGALIAFTSIEMLQLVRKRTGVRRDYESIYSLGVAFAAFAAAEAVHGSGFLAAFAAGLTISALDVELCDCFLEYGQTTAEMALLFTFVLFGTSVVWTAFSIVTPVTLVFAGLVFLARPAALIPALLPARTMWRSRALIAWFGPRGLSSLLLVLLAVFAGVDGALPLVAISSLVVLCSVVIHGFSPLLLRGDTGKPTEIAGESCPLRQQESPALEDSEYTSIDEYLKLVKDGQSVTLVDARTERTLAQDRDTASGSVRIDPERAVQDAQRLELPKDEVLLVFCA